MSSHIEIYNPSLVFLLHFTKSHSGLFPFGTGDLRARVGNFFVQKAVAALSTCFDEDGARVEGLEWGLTSATEDIWMGCAIKFVLALRSCKAEDCKFGLKRVLHYVWGLKYFTYNFRMSGSFAS